MCKKVKYKLKKERFSCKVWFENGVEMARISAIFFFAPLPPHHFFYFRGRRAPLFLVRAGGA